MVNRIALLVGSVAAAAVLTVALAAAGFAPAATTPTEPPPVADAAALDTSPATQQATTQVDTVYVQPAASPKIVRVVRKAAAKAPVIVRQTIRSAGGGDDGHDSGEGADD